MRSWPKADLSGVLCDEAESWLRFLIDKPESFTDNLLKPFNLFVSCRLFA